METIALVYSFGWRDFMAMDDEQLEWWADAAKQRLEERAQAAQR